MCDILDDWLGINPAPQTQQKSAAQVDQEAAAQAEKDKSAALLKQAQDADKRRGRGALIVNGAGNDFGANLYSTAPKAARVLIGAA